MSWVIDTGVLLDVLEDDPAFGESSANCIDALAPDGLVVSPISYAEMAPAFRGNRALQNEFLDGMGVTYREDWTFEDTLRAHRAWHEHILRRRKSGGSRRPIADILIGSFAARFQGLVTRNDADFRTAFSDLVVQVPESV